MAVTLITGTSTGIGMETALHLAGRGHTVYASMRSLDRATALRDAAAARHVSPHIVQLDVTDTASVERAVAQILAREGRIDVLVNNAGIGMLGSTEFTSDEDAHAVFETNYFGALRMIRAVLPPMRAQRSGTIVSVSSVAGRIAPGGMGAYPASKWALEAACEALAQEVTSLGIRVALVEPGFIVTPILDKALDSLTPDPSSPYADIERRVSMIFGQARVTGGTPRQVADTIEHAITTSQPALRYPVGVDAQALIPNRARMTDAEWIALGRKQTDAEYFTEFAARFPMATQAEKA
jgi:NAD(P)-dependent dehydrogenase (short-subunit alcohol dehydrogenase family)